MIRLMNDEINNIFNEPRWTHDIIISYSKYISNENINKELKILLHRKWLKPIMRMSVYVI